MTEFFLAHPHGLWALAGTAVVTALYLFHRRFRPRVVTGLFLWGDSARKAAGGRTVEFPVSNRSFWLDIAAAACLAVAVAGPAWRTSVRPVVLLVDGSFALHSRGGLPRMLDAITACADAAAAAGAETAVILAGPRPAVLIAMGRFTGADVLPVLAGHVASATASDLRAGLALAREMYGPESDIHLFTNQPPSREEEAHPVVGVTRHIFPGRGGNLAFGEIWRDVEPASDRERVIFSVVNHATVAVDVTVEIRMGSAGTGHVIHTETMTLGPAATGHRQLAVSAAAGEKLTISLISDGEDAIPEDSVAVVPPPPRMDATYGISGPDPVVARYLRLGLEAAGLRPAAVPEQADILISTDPAAQGRALTLELLPEEDPGVPLEPCSVDAGHELCRDVEIPPLIWVAARPSRPERPERVLIASGAMPLYWLSAPGRLHLNLAVGRSGLSRDPAWPILFANLAAYGRSRLPGPRQTLYRPGEKLLWSAVDPEAGEGMLVRDGEVVARFQPGVGVAVPGVPGTYAVRMNGIDEAVIAVAPLYGPASDTTVLADREETLLGESREGGGMGTTNFFWVFLVAGLVLMIVNWRRRPA